MATMGLATGYQNLPSVIGYQQSIVKRFKSFSDVHQLLKILRTLITLEKLKILAIQ